MSDSDQVLGRQKPLRAIFGDGPVTEVLSWKNKKLSAAISTGFTVIWLLFEVFEYHFFTFLCHLLIIIMLLLFSWNKLAVLTKWDPPNMDEFEISESTFSHLFGKINWLLSNLFKISYGEDLKLFVMTIAILWLLSAIGDLASSLNLIYIMFVCLQILPVLYENYEDDVDQLAAAAKSQFNNSYQTFNSQVLSRIPRAHQA